jgi:hypothetical protein
MLATAVLDKLVNSTPINKVASYLYEALALPVVMFHVSTLPVSSQRRLLQALLDIACQ